ncbi:MULTISPECIES: sulfate adenylyltransferase subunit CysN [Pseudoalteromonas]|uniref:Sulfate adenylyltransferase subunit 1 n=1 Tax=Pseudoalteromonas amylolytica TaxID=1859457 RepID=A0A1S1MVB7_9GAMM|nr:MULTISPECIES: sulfate adenylyltransferase subunit CysN [Pseudoalteromonas]OHU90669.1 sulfate adenylyltransferase subunit CysN [Pseudoalteromonas sp. JW3]OHU92710.1 sulfate adenylyltransferase subunit CysN [Pseudoalteromonas amylolytica]
MSHASELIETNILEYLEQHENKELLRFITCGSVDDGKSTLIGRLLHDSKMIFEDQLAAIEKDSKKSGTTGEQVDLALLVDGLQSEREQGITIDVAYRYFSTDKRKFIIADTPGHEQYTRNMATGASTADLAIILVDARYGVQIQTKRHSFIASLLGIKHVVVAVNKMDLVEYSEHTFTDICEDYKALANELSIPDIHFAPISALKGDNVVNLSDNMPWYKGQALMSLLETLPINTQESMSEFRFPVQYVNRPNLNYRGFAGTIASGSVAVGDKVKVLPSGKETQIKSIDTFEGSLDSASAPYAVTLTTNDEVDISRGDMLVHNNSSIHLANQLQAHVVWMDDNPLQLNREYLLKFATKQTSAHVSAIQHKINVNTFAKEQGSHLDLNEIALCELALNSAVAVDEYERNRQTGAFIVIDRLTNSTVGAGMVASASDIGAQQTNRRVYTEAEIQLNKYIRTHYPEWNTEKIS